MGTFFEKRPHLIFLRFERFEGIAFSFIYVIILKRQEEILIWNNFTTL